MLYHQRVPIRRPFLNGNIQDSVLLCFRSYVATFVDNLTDLSDLDQTLTAIEKVVHCNVSE